jgi:Zn-dependent M28 family amino/carboxypeptidase
LFAALIACNDDAMTGPDGGDPTGDGASGDGAGCQRPALDQPWLSGLVSGVVTQLASAPRYTTTQRSTARTYLSDQLMQMGWSPMLHNYPSGANVYATLPATTGATRQIIVGAHFDTVSGSPGANDNATGCGAVMAIARYLKDMTCRNAVIKIVFFDEEEQGLFGARAFAQTLSPADVLAVHTIDQVGWDMDNDKRFEIELPTATLEAEYRTAASVVGVPVTKTSSGGTDHEAFRDLGFAAVGVSEEYVGGDTSPWRHSVSDTADTVKFSYNELAAKLAAQVIMTEAAPP